MFDLFSASKTLKLFQAEPEDRWERVGKTSIFSGMPLVIGYRAVSEQELESVPVKLRLVEAEEEDPLSSVGKMFGANDDEQAKRHHVEVFIPARHVRLIGVVS